MPRFSHSRKNNHLTDYGKEGKWSVGLVSDDDLGSLVQHVRRLAVLELH